VEVEVEELWMGEIKEFYIPIEAVTALLFSMWIARYTSSPVPLVPLARGEVGIGYARSPFSRRCYSYYFDSSDSVVRSLSA
jgi:hypothetical protein